MLFVLDSVRKQRGDETEALVKSHIGNMLKFAPFQQKGERVNKYNLRINS